MVQIWSDNWVWGRKERAIFNIGVTQWKSTLSLLEWTWYKLYCKGLKDSGKRPRVRVTHTNTYIHIRIYIWTSLVWPITYFQTLLCLFAVCRIDEKNVKIEKYTYPLPNEFRGLVKLNDKLSLVCYINGAINVNDTSLITPFLSWHFYFSGQCKVRFCMIFSRHHMM